ncbi:retropepsin-like aspartic protease [Plantactinospora siamensis]|uniref:Retropepsin-like aspartic protease n=1 Tax=Plantactinospora siamensis TaxID=555372 RepID=A0ABV6P4R2_9ACTN
MVNTVVPFDRVQHLVRVPVELAGDGHRFLMDTGIGVTVVSSAIAARPDVRPTGQVFGARRMSGQLVEAPLVRLPRLRLGAYTVDDHLACVADLGETDGPAGFTGILGLGFLGDHAYTTDPAASTLTVHPAADVPPGGVEIPLEIRRNGPSVDPFARLVLPSGREVLVEIDTGSGSLILDTRFMADCGIEPGAPEVTTTTGTDETGYAWTRHWATIPGAVHLAAAPQTRQAAPRVQFQRIIHDGLLGAEYLDRYRYCVDPTGARLVLGPLAPPGQALRADGAEPAGQVVPPGGAARADEAGSAGQVAPAGQVGPGAPAGPGDRPGGGRRR